MVEQARGQVLTTHYQNHDCGCGGNLRGTGKTDCGCGCGGGRCGTIRQEPISVDFKLTVPLKPTVGPV